jgi:Rps23 Pro-64 3,4-dihydroxylase Tpa1-like proline 4-hydroxylase
MNSLSDQAQLLIDSNILDKAVIALENRLKHNPDDLKTLESLGRVYRQKGELLKSSSIYNKIHEIQPENQAANYLRNLMCGTVSRIYPPGNYCRPCPFVYFQDFLPHNQHRTLLKLIRDNQHEFQSGTVGGGRYEKAIRHQLVLIHKDITSIIEHAIISNLPNILSQIQFTDVSIKEAHINNLHLALTHHGHYGQPHKDDSGGKHMVTCVYHLYEEPKKFSGGDLILFDTNVKENIYQGGEFTKINIKNNALIVYPSDYYHQITKVHCPGVDFIQGRFAVAGHIGFV